MQDIDNFLAAYAKNTVKGIPFFEMNRPMGRASRYTGDIGLELEVEAARPLPRDGDINHLTSKSGTYWMAIQDGSLRGESREYIFNKPCKVDELSFLNDTLFNKFDELRSTLNNSNRCSTHVHINAKKKTVNQLTSVIILWSVFEEILIKWCGEERQTNHFALSFKDASGLVQRWSRFLRTGESIAEDSNLKYAALNFLPLWSLGSIEFRCGRAPESADYVTTWATFLYEFCQYAWDKYIDPSRIANDISEAGGFEIFRDICSKNSGILNTTFIDEVKAGMTVEDFNLKCTEGFRIAQELALGFPWNDWLPMINKEYIVDPFAQKKSKVRGGLRQFAIERDQEDLQRAFDALRNAPPQAVPRMRIEPVLHEMRGLDRADPFNPEF